MERRRVSPREQRAAVQQLGVWFSVDPELNKRHPLPSYESYVPARRNTNQIDSFLMNESLYDPDWTDAEKAIAEKMAIISIAFVAFFGTYLAIESDNRDAARQGAEPEAKPAYMYPAADAGHDEPLEP